ncbi:MAG TPA: hypothetical protein VFZ19_01430 [Solirubrobacterales bacterium]
MSGGDVPAWTAVAVAALTGVLGFLAPLLAARIAARLHRQELDQQQLLHGADARLQALDGAATTAIDYRERVGAALSVLADSETPRVGVEPMWSFDRPDVVAFLRHDAALTLRFGRNHPVSEAWRVYAWQIGEAAETAKQQRRWADGASDQIPEEVKDDARARRRATRKQLEKFLEVASTPLEHNAQHYHGS